jgi:hypothetical protein
MKTANILGKISEMIHDSNFLAAVRVRPADFTRKRSVPFVPLMFILLSILSRSLQIELDEFIAKYLPKVKTYTKQSFSEARMKIQPKAFKLLNQTVLSEVYATSKARLLAIDGSKIQIPDNAKTRAYFGTITNNHEGFETAQALASCLYDVDNKMIIDAQLSQCTDSERRLAKLHIDALGNNTSDIIIFDRGYASFELIKYLEAHNLRYLMRVKSNFFKEVNNTNSPDEIVRIEITPMRKKHLKQQGCDVEVGASITVRVVKFALPSGEIETLITNLKTEEYTVEELKAFYFRRWEIEISYDILKNKLEIENFSGDSVIAIQQDFNMIILLSNIASVIAEEAGSLSSKKGAAVSINTK